MSYIGVSVLPLLLTPVQELPRAHIPPHGFPCCVSAPAWCLSMGWSMSYSTAGEFALIVVFMHHVSLPFVRVSQWGQPVSHFYSLKLNFALWHPFILLGSVCVSVGRGMRGALQEFCKSLLTAEREKGVKYGLKWHVSHGALQLVLYSVPPTEGFRKRKK